MRSGLLAFCGAHLLGYGFLRLRLRIRDLVLHIGFEGIEYLGLADLLFSCHLDHLFFLLFTSTQYTMTASL